MMTLQTGFQTRPLPKPALTAAPGRLLQRSRACSGLSAGKGEATDERRTTAGLRQDGSLPSAALGHDFGRVRLRPGCGRGLQVDGLAISAPADEEIVLDQTPAPAPGVTPPPPPPPPTPGRGSGSPPPAAPTRPTTISVAQVFQAPLAVANVTAGFHTGFGGVARMEVSDPSGHDWAGTAVHENIASATNTCQPGTSACPNTGGQGGAAGSTFNVGDPTSALGFSLPAVRNSFYDLHLFGQQSNLLGDVHLPHCEQTCTQFYDLGGTRFGPTFTISRSMTPDRISVSGTPVDVTQVALDKR